MGEEIRYGKINYVLKIAYLVIQADTVLVSLYLLIHFLNIIVR